MVTLQATLEAISEKLTALKVALVSDKSLRSTTEIVEGITIGQRHVKQAMIAALYVDVHRITQGIQNDKALNVNLRKRLALDLDIWKDQLGEFIFDVAAAGILKRLKNNFILIRVKIRELGEKCYDDPTIRTKISTVQIKLTVLEQKIQGNISLSEEEFIVRQFADLSLNLKQINAWFAAKQNPALQALRQRVIQIWNNILDDVGDILERIYTQKMKKKLSRGQDAAGQKYLELRA